MRPVSPNQPLTCVRAGVHVRVCRVERVGMSYGIELVCPPPSLCTDNAAMIAWAAIEYATSDEHDLNGMISREADFLDDGAYGVQIRSRWPLGVDYREWTAGVGD
jgi:N6-L-threonylcarbamoyladenine synthase